jgi:hypothetical protein
VTINEAILQGEFSKYSGLPHGRIVIVVPNYLVEAVQVENNKP